MLKEDHPLSGLTCIEGFQIAEPKKSVYEGGDYEINVPDLVWGPKQAPQKPGYVPLRQAIPHTEGRLMGWKLKDHVISSKARNWPTFKPFEFSGQSIAICGGGPSLPYTLHELRRLQKNGTKVMAINRTHDFLLNLPETHRMPWVKPWAGIILEAVPNAANYMKPTKGVRYYVGSQCAPQTFDQYESCEHYIWHAQSKPELLECLTVDEIKNVVPAVGSTCGLRAIVLAYMMGFTDIHVFGLDSCYSEYEVMNGIRSHTGKPKLHSYDKPEAIHDVRETIVQGWGDGRDRKYWANGNMLAQAEEFNGFCEWRNKQVEKRLMDPHRVIVHGFGLIPDMARAWGLHADNFKSERIAA